MARRWVVAASLLLVSAAATEGQDAPILFRGARVFDGVRILGTRDVLVRDGRIGQIASRIVPPPGADIVDAVGKTLLPGLIDSHTHAFGDALVQALAFGVTTELDMFTDAAQAARWRQEQRNGQANGRADIFSAGILVTSPKGHGTEYGMVIPTISSPDSAQSFVDARIAEGSDYIKIVYDNGAAYGMSIPTISLATMRAVIAAAHRRGKLAVVHVGASAASREAIEAGADGLVHAHADRDADAEFIALVAKRGAFVIPTLSVNLSVTGTAGGSRLVSDARLDPMLRMTDVTQLKQAFPIRRTATLRYAAAEGTVRQLKSAGVRILAGTDAPNPGTAHGASMHGELEFLVKAGLTPVEALAAATSVPAQAFGITDRGRIATGLRADLLLVDGDPTVDVTNTRSIAGVWKAGLRFDREAYGRNAARTRMAAGAAPAGSESGEVSGFDDGTTTTKFGLGWSVSTDQMAGGKSTAEIGVVDGGASGSPKALRITGLIDASVPYAWAGAVFMPGSVPMEPTNLSAKKELSFWARGDGQMYRVMLFAQSRGMMPLFKTFQADTAWKEYNFPLASFGTDAKDLLMVLVVGGPAPGKFDIRVDDVRFR
jgi:imidazolonepropionase-like amidohydrolase